LAEKEIEEFLIKKLISQEYQKVDIKGKEDLENNLRTQIHLNNPKYLKDYPLTDEEFQRMISKLNNVKNSFEASQILRDKFTLERDNGEKILLNLYDTKKLVSK
jgi:type I restriction enzyme, R subunit